MKKLIPLLCLSLFFFYQCQTPAEKKPVAHEEEAHLGKISIEVNGAKEALPYFEEGLLLLHSFEYEDAAEKFIKAQDLDSSFVMAYWGEAMTKNKPLWSVQQIEEGRTALNKLAATPELRAELAQTEFEKDLLKGTEILFGTGEKLERDDWYKDHMEKLHQKYPTNHEVAALYALSLLGSVDEGRDFEVYGQGATIAKGILEENPSHPGALHYLIHSYDDPEHASNALEAAHRYSKVAPDAGHALHMPSHIYIAKGMWDEVILSNIASWEATVARMKRKKLDHNDRGFHSLKWLMYGYLQQHDYTKAKQQLELMELYHDRNPTKSARGHLIMMRGAFLTESGDWDDPIATKFINEADLAINIKAVQNYTHARIKFLQETEKGLNELITDLSQEIKTTKKQILTKGSKMCSGGTYQGVPTQVDVNQAEVIEMEMKALLAMLQNKPEQVTVLLEKATELEKSTSFNFGPPMIVKPSSEMFAEWLIEQNKIELAKEHYQEVLSRAPNRWIAKKGLKAVEG